MIEQTETQASVDAICQIMAPKTRRYFGRDAYRPDSKLYWREQGSLLAVLENKTGGGQRGADPLC